MPRRSNRTVEQVAAFKDVLANGGSIQRAMLAAGYSEGMAKQGLAKLPEQLKSFALDKIRPYIEMGRKITAEEQESAARGMLLANLAEGKDRAVKSAELLGRDKRVNMFTPEIQQGIIMLNVPESLASAPLDEQPLLPKKP